MNVWNWTTWAGMFFLAVLLVVQTRENERLTHDGRTAADAYERSVAQYDVLNTRHVALEQGLRDEAALLRKANATITAQRQACRAELAEAIETSVPTITFPNAK